MSTTTYEIRNDDTVVETRTRKESAIDFAEGLIESAPSHVITVVTEAGTEVFRFDPEPAPAPTTGRAKPFTRVETKASFEIPEVTGYTAAYVRNRTKTVVYRANDKSGWLVLDTRDNKQTVVANTTEARQLTNELEAALKVAVKEAKEQEAADKATKREAKAAERKARKEAEDKAKADRKAARQAAKAAVEPTEA